MYWRVDQMTDNSDEDVAQKDDPSRLIKLAVFFVICVLLGVGALFFAFAPNVNPSFINECLFYPQRSDSISSDWLADSDDVFAAEFNRALHKMRQAIAKSDFDELRLRQPEDLSFKSSDGTTLHGWFFKAVNDRGTVLLNWNGICDMRLPVLLGYVRVFQKANLSVFTYDYRGFGKSEGTPETLKTFEQDGEAAYDYLLNQRKIPAHDIVLMGSQLGAHIALDQNAHHECEAMILETPWTNLKKWIDEIPAAQAMCIVPESFYPSGAFDNTHFVTGKHVPILFVFTAPLPNHGANLFQSATAPKQSVELRSAQKLFIPLLAHVGSQYTKAVNELLK
jgi:alpha-beta hydrolase superfamily lysophospholipase